MYLGVVGVELVGALNRLVVVTVTSICGWCSGGEAVVVVGTVLVVVVVVVV